MPYRLRPDCLLFIFLPHSFVTPNSFTTMNLFFHLMLLPLLAIVGESSEGGLAGEKHEEMVVSKVGVSEVQVEDTKTNKNLSEHPPAPPVVEKENLVWQTPPEVRHVPQNRLLHVGMGLLSLLVLMLYIRVRCTRLVTHVASCVASWIALWVAT